MDGEPTSYCDAVADDSTPEVHRAYHDTVYGFPVHHDDELFGRLVLEMNQAGLSWTTILNKQENFRRAFDGFNIAQVASYGEADRARLLSDAGIIRNRLKVDAAIYNARRIVELQHDYGSFKAWLDEHVGLKKDAWVRLFKKEFKFTGGEITGEFLMSTGYLPGAHVEQCPVYRRILRLDPPWRLVSG